MSSILITGGAGFIGSNFIHYTLNRSQYNIINFDALTYAGNIRNLETIKEHPRYKFIKGDITSQQDLLQLQNEDIDFIINFLSIMAYK